MPLIQLDHVSKFYSQGKTSAKGLDDISLTFDKGDFVAITGESGSGKTTLLNVVTLMDVYDEGDILFEGKSTADFNEDDLLSFRRDYVSFVFQEYNLIPNLNAIENLIIALINKGYERKEAKKKAIDSLTKCGLEKRMKEKVVKLSGGERQRVVIARALALDSPIIAFDEPTGNLDSKTSKEIIQLIDKIKNDRLILYVTHDYEAIEKVANRHIVLGSGRLVSDVVTGERNVGKEEEETIENRKKNSLSSLLLSCLALILSAPKKLLLMCLAVFLLSFSMVGLVLASTYCVSVFQSGLEYIYNQYHPNAFQYQPENSLVFISEDGKDIPTETPSGAIYYDPGSYLPYLHLYGAVGTIVDPTVYNSRDSYFSSSMDINISLPKDCRMLLGEKEEDREGFYLLFDEGERTWVEDFLPFFEENLGKKSRYDDVHYPILSLPSRLWQEDPLADDLAEIIESLPFLGVAFCSMETSMNVALTIPAASTLSDALESYLVTVLKNGLPAQSLDSLSYNLNVPFDFGSGSELGLSFSYQGEDLSATVTPMTEEDPFLGISPLWQGKEEDVQVDVAGKTFSLKAFFELFADIYDPDTLYQIGPENSHVTGSLFDPNADSGEVLVRRKSADFGILTAVMLVRSRAISFAYYPDSESLRASQALLEEEGYMVFPSDYRYWTGSEPNGYEYVIYCMSGFGIAFLVFLLLFLFLFITFPILRSILKRYNADFAVLTTLGYPKRSLFLFRSLIILFPMVLTYLVLSLIALLVLNHFDPVYAFPYTYLYVIGLVLLLLFGLLLLYRFYKAEKKRTLTSVLKDSGGQR